MWKKERKVSLQVCGWVDRLCVFFFCWAQEALNVHSQSMSSTTTKTTTSERYHNLCVIHAEWSCLQTHTYTHTSSFTVTRDELVTHFAFVMTMVRGRLRLNLIIVIFIVMAYGERVLKGLFLWQSVAFYVIPRVEVNKKLYYHHPHFETS